MQEFCADHFALNNGDSKRVPGHRIWLNAVEQKKVEKMYLHFLGKFIQTPQAPTMAFIPKVSIKILIQ